MTQHILEAGGTLPFTFHVLFMLFIAFVIYQFFLNQYEFWYSFLLMLFVFATINGALRAFNLVNNYGFKPNIRGLIFPLVGLILIVLKLITT